MHTYMHEGGVVARLVKHLLTSQSRKALLAETFACVAAISALLLGSAGVCAQNVTIVPPNLAGGIVGSLGGSAVVTQSGSATYSIPLPLPPGTGGLVPTVVLNYSSQSGAGMLGHGWSVGGQSVITRCGKTYAQDGVRRGVALTSEDQFCLDGQRLLIVAGVHGAAAEYRTEVDNFSQVVSFGSDTSTGPDQWIVKTKNGLIYTYGATADSKVEAQGNSVVLFWALSRVEDRRGNYYAYDYVKNNGEGEHYLSRIRYTGNIRTAAVTYNAVDFVYEQRTDPWRGYVMGSVVKRKQRLTAVRASINTTGSGTGGTLVREFRIGYDANAVTGRSLLHSVSDCDGQGNCFIPTLFSYSTRSSAANTLNAPGSGVWGGPAITIEEAVGHPLVGIPEQQVQAKAVIGDFNGDGAADIFYAEVIPKAGVSSKVCLSTKTSFSCSDWPGVPNRSEEVMSGDFNGDGLTDIAAMSRETSGVVNWKICLSTGSGFSCSSWPARGAGLSPQRYLITDMDGDGRDDLLLYDAFGGSYLCRSNGASFDPCVTYTGIAAALYSGNDPEIRIRTARRGADLNGDGRLDFIKYVMGTGVPAYGRWETYLATDTGFVLGPNANSAGVAIAVPSPGATTVLDYNGDPFGSYGDTASSIGTGGGSAIFEVCQSTGVSLLCDVRPYTAGQYVESFGDFDSDGQVDFLSGNSICQLSDTAASPCTPLDSPTLPFYTGSVLGDFNGDGLLDHAYYDQNSGQWTVRLTGNGGLQDLLTEVVDGLGKRTQFSHSGIENVAVYSVGGAATYPARNLVHGPAVVTQIKQSNGQGGWLVTDYKYESLRTDVQGRGSLGFLKMMATDQSTEVSTLTTHGQQFPYVGMTQTAMSTQSNGVVLSSTSNVLAALPTTAGAKYPYVKSSTVVTRDLNGALISTVTSAVNDVAGIDGYGNITSSTDSITEPGGDIYTTVTSSTYENRSADWLLGLLSTRTVSKSTSLVGTGLTPPTLTLRNCVNSGATTSPVRATLSCALGNLGQTAAASVSYSGLAWATVNGPSSCAAGSSDCGRVLIQSGTAPGTYEGSFQASTNGGAPAIVAVSLTVNNAPAVLITVSGSVNSTTMAPTVAEGTLTFSNSGQSATTLNFSVSGGASVHPLSVNCPAQQACDSTVRVFSPATAGTYNGTLDITSTVGQAPSPIPVTLKVNTPPSIAVTGSVNATTTAPTVAEGTLTLSNSGQTATTLNFSVSGGASVQPDSVNCPAQQACDSTVRVFSPTTAGTYDGTLSITSTVGAAPSSIPVTLRVNTPPSIGVTGSINATTMAPTAAEGTLTFSNSGQAATTLSFSVTGGASVQPDSVNCPAQQGCDSTVRVFTPTAAGTYNGTLYIASSVGQAPSPISVTLKVNTPPAIGVTGSVNATTVAPTVAEGTLTFNNTGQTATTLSFSVTGGASVQPASINCPPLQACDSTVRVFSPTTAGTYSGLLNISSSVGPAVSAIPVTLKVKTPAALTLTQVGNANLAYSLAPTPAKVSYQLGNTGQTDASGIVYSSLTDISREGGPTTCAAGVANCGVITLTSVTAAGNYGGNFNATPSAGSGASTTVTLMVTEPKLTFDGLTSYPFGTKAVESDTYSSPIRLRNSGTATATSLVLTVPSPGFAFDYVHTDCGTSLDPGASCFLVVRFVPLLVQSYSGLVQATATGTSASFTVSGTAEIATTTVNASASPSGMPDVQTNGTQRFTITVSNAGSAVASGIVLTLNQPYSPPGSYAIVGGTCGSTLTGGGSCTVLVDYQATCVIGESDAVLTISGNNFAPVSPGMRSRTIGSQQGCD